MTKPIHHLETPNQVLRLKAVKIKLENIASQSFQTLIQEMQTTMREAPGVGLAAPQIGESLQLAVIEDSAERLLGLPQEILKERGRQPVEFHVLINPEIIEKTGQINYFFEGCLSVPGHVRVTPRYETVTVRYLNELGVEKTVTAHGWYARILQHEIDHLNGVLYIDIADPRTDLLVDDYFKQEWMFANKEKIHAFYHACCPLHEARDKS